MSEEGGCEGDRFSLPQHPRPERDGVAVVTPNFNSGGLLWRLHSSIHDQGMNEDQVTWFVVDDASSDESTVAIRELQKVCACIQVVMLPQNVGAGQARNMGLLEVDRKWVTFVDADDYLESGALNAWLTKACRTGAELLVTEQPATVRGRMRVKDISEPVTGRRAAIDAGIVRNWYVGGKLYRTATLRENGVEFSARGHGEDLVFFLRALATIEAVHYAVALPRYVYPVPARALVSILNPDVLATLENFELSIALSGDMAESDRLKVISPVLGGLCAVALGTLAGETNPRIQGQVRDFLRAAFRRDAVRCSSLPSIDSRDRLIVAAGLVVAALPMAAASALARMWVRSR